jgi:hypothetical protein
MEITKTRMLEIVQSNEVRLEDRLAERYLLASTLETQVHKEREVIKSSVLSYTRGALSVPRKIEETVDLVNRTSLSTNILLFNGLHYDVGAQIKTAGSVVDLDVLQSVLGVSELRWAKALAEATIPRNPSLTLLVARRTVKGVK